MASVKISDLRQLRERIIRYRATHDLSQTEFATMCGLTRPTIGAIESGGYRPNRPRVSEITIFKIRSVLDEAEATER